MNRRYPDRPVASVGAVVVGPEGVLLIRRGQPPLQGEWSLPGGAVETGETLAAAVAREVREEAGIDVEVGPLLDVFDRVHMDADGRVEYHYVLIDFLCRYTGGTLQGASDAMEACWAAPDSLPGYRLSDAALGVIRKGLELAGLPA